MIVHDYFLADKVVAIFGATGFIGSHLTEALLFSNCIVRASGRNLPGLIPLIYSLILISLSKNVI